VESKYLAKRRLKTTVQCGANSEGLNKMVLPAAIAEIMGLMVVTRG
jgi:hypothetical protein